MIYKNNDKYTKLLMRGAMIYKNQNTQRNSGVTPYGKMNN